MTQTELHHKVHRIEIAAKKHVQDTFSGIYASAFKGRGIEVEDIREFQTGDDYRAIDWAKTAQTGKPYVKNFHQERDLTVMLLADVSGSLSFGSQSETKRERLAEIAALIAFSAIYNHDRVGLLLFSDKVEKIIHPRRGVRHGARLIRELIGFQPTSIGTDIAAALDFFNQGIKKRCICFLLSDFLSANYEHQIGFTAKKDDLIQIRIYDMSEKSMQPGLAVVQDLESAQQQLVDVNARELANILERWEEAGRCFRKIASKYGQEFLEIEVREPFLAKLLAFFKMRKRRLR